MVAWRDLGVPNKTPNREMKFKAFFDQSFETTGLIEIMINKAHECNIKSSTVRQLLMPLVKRQIAHCTGAELAQICEHGNNFDPVPLEYREAHLVTTGTNAWSAIFLSTSDSGLQMLQKIAVASLLSDVCEDIKNVTPREIRATGLAPFEIISLDLIDELAQLGKTLAQKMGW